VTARDLPTRVRGAGAAPAASIPNSEKVVGSLRAHLERIEKEAIVLALRETGGNQTEAARRLDMPLRTLQQKIKTYDIKKLYAAGA
jgi:DNA-binding NtrC family response regulator